LKAEGTEGQQRGLKAEQSGGCCSEMKGEIQELREKIDRVASEVEKLKPTSNEIVIDYPVFMCIVGVLVGLLVSYMLFK
jgi:type II secretory pathway component PulF